MTIGFVLPYVHLTKITTISGQVYGFSSLNLDVTYAGNIYTGAVGAAPTVVKRTTGLSVDNLELVLLKTGTPFSEEQVIRGLLEEAQVKVLVEDLAELPPTEADENVIFKGYVGRVESTPTSYKVELRSFASKLNNAYTYKVSPYCRWEFGSVQCGINLDTSPLGLSHTTTIASISSLGNGTHNISLSTPIPATNRGRYKLGYIQSLGGSDNLRKIRVSDVSTDGLTINVANLPPFEFADTTNVKLVASCDKQQATCGAYNNFPNFGGFPQSYIAPVTTGNYMVGLDQVLQSGRRTGEST